MKHIPAIFVMMLLIASFVYFNVREERRIIKERARIEQIQKKESNLEKVNRVEKELSQIQEVFETSNNDDIILFEEDCSPVIEVKNEYRFKSAIGFTMSITNDCNYVLPGGYLTVKLMDKNNFIVAEKMVKHNDINPFTSQIFEVVFKNIGELGAISYGLRYDR